MQERTTIIRFFIVSSIIYSNNIYPWKTTTYAVDPTSTTFVAIEGVALVLLFNMLLPTYAVWHSPPLQVPKCGLLNYCKVGIDGFLWNKMNFEVVLGEPIDLWRIQIAVKRLKIWSTKAEMEFAVEIEILGRVRHKNLLSLRGYCAEGQERVIVYDYMPKLSLLSHLHGQFAADATLDWQRRMKIAIGTAEGLA